MIIMKNNRNLGISIHEQNQFFQTLNFKFVFHQKNWKKLVERITMKCCWDLNWSFSNLEDSNLPKHFELSTSKMIEITDFQSKLFYFTFIHQFLFKFWWKLPSHFIINFFSFFSNPILVRNVSFSSTLSKFY